MKGSTRVTSKIRVGVHSDSGALGTQRVRGMGAFEYRHSPRYEVNGGEGLHGGP